MITLRQFFESGILRGDHGGPLESTPLLEDVIAAYDGDHHNRVIVSPRRNGKSSAVSILAAYELLTKPGSFTVWVSGSGDQASDIVEQKLRRPLSQNADLQSFNIQLQASRSRLVNPELGSVCEVIAPSEVSAPGRTISLLLIDEARGVPESVVEILRPSAAAGKIFVIGTPGPPRGWFHKQATEPGPRDFVRHHRRLLNPSVPQRFVDDERKRLERRGAWGSLIFKREWEAQWADLTENPLLSPADVEAGSKNPEEIEPYERGKDWTVIGVDLSIRRDLTSIVTVALRDREDTFRVIDCQVIDPKERGGEVLLEEVENRLLRLYKELRPRRIVMDAYQGISMAQRLRRKAVRIEPVHVTSLVNQEIFECLAEVISARRITWPKNERLEGELMNLELSENQSSWKVVDSDRKLHRDLAFSTALALNELVKHRPVKPTVR